MTGWRLRWAHLRGRRCKAVRKPRLDDSILTPAIRCVLIRGHEHTDGGWAHEGPAGFGYRWWKD